MLTKAVILLFLWALAQAGPILTVNQEEKLLEDQRLARNTSEACHVSGKAYMEGEAVPSDSPCQDCSCHSSGVACEAIVCSPYKPHCKRAPGKNNCCTDYICECEKDGIVYQNGDYIQDPANPCEFCYCQGGDMFCSTIVCKVLHNCEPQYKEGQCCPIYKNCIAIEDNAETPPVVNDPNQPVNVLLGNEDNKDEANSKVISENQSPSETEALVESTDAADSEALKIDESNMVKKNFEENFEEAEKETHINDQVSLTKVDILPISQDTEENISITEGKNPVIGETIGTPIVVEIAQVEKLTTELNSDDLDKIVIDNNDNGESTVLETKTENLPSEMQIMTQEKEEAKTEDISTNNNEEKLQFKASKVKFQNIDIRPVPEDEQKSGESNNEETLADKTDPMYWLNMEKRKNQETEVKNASNADYLKDVDKSNAENSPVTELVKDESDEGLIYTNKENTDVITTDTPKTDSTLQEITDEVVKVVLTHAEPALEVDSILVEKVDSEAGKEQLAQFDMKEENVEVNTESNNEQSKAAEESNNAIEKEITKESVEENYPKTEFEPTEETKQLGKLEVKTSDSELEKQENNQKKDDLSSKKKSEIGEINIAENQAPKISPNVAIQEEDMLTTKNPIEAANEKNQNKISAVNSELFKESPIFEDTLSQDRFYHEETGEVTTPEETDSQTTVASVDSANEAKESTEANLILEQADVINPIIRTEVIVDSDTVDSDTVDSVETENLLEKNSASESLVLDINSELTEGKVEQETNTEKIEEDISKSYIATQLKSDATALESNTNELVHTDSIHNIEQNETPIQSKFISGEKGTGLNGLINIEIVQTTDAIEEMTESTVEEATEKEMSVVGSSFPDLAIETLSVELNTHEAVNNHPEHKSQLSWNQADSEQINDFSEFNTKIDEMTVQQRAELKESLLEKTTIYAEEDIEPVTEYANLDDGQFLDILATVETVKIVNLDEEASSTLMPELNIKNDNANIESIAIDSVADTANEAEIKEYNPQSLMQENIMQEPSSHNALELIETYKDIQQNLKTVEEVMENVEVAKQKRKGEQTFAQDSISIVKISDADISNKEGNNVLDSEIVANISKIEDQNINEQKETVEPFSSATNEDLTTDIAQLASQVETESEQANLSSEPEISKSDSLQVFVYSKNVQEVTDTVSETTEDETAKNINKGEIMTELNAEETQLLKSEDTVIEKPQDEFTVEIKTEKNIDEDSIVKDALVDVLINKIEGFNANNDNDVKPHVEPNAEPIELSQDIALPIDESEVQNFEKVSESVITVNDLFTEDTKVLDPNIQTKKDEEATLTEEIINSNGGEKQLNGDVMSQTIDNSEPLYDLPESDSAINVKPTINADSISSIDNIKSAALDKNDNDVEKNYIFEEKVDTDPKEISNEQARINDRDSAKKITPRNFLFDSIYKYVRSFL